MKNWKTTILNLLVLILAHISCTNTKNTQAPTVGFVDAFEDSTIAQAKTGFLDALKASGFSEGAKTLNLVYRNAQGNIPTLTQIVQYFISQEVTLMATCPTLSTVTALQNTKKIPIFMMVAPTPAIMGVQDAAGNPPANLFGVADDLAYIDTSFAIITNLVKPKGSQLRVGMIYNQAEPQSVDAFERLEALAKTYDVALIALPVNATADAQLVTAALLNENIDAFFANPDNTVFGAFETILKSCNEARVPVFTSEAGLVARGAVAAYGADIYQWGYQAGKQAAQFLKTGSTDGLQWEMVELRKRVYNPEAAERFGIEVPGNFQTLTK
ncbi:MAG: ABC transporter substrate-binding protein [Saprospiraceae bacterium]|nr:ABC transporter substrate-binding protein [Lewinellaceae bacterium]